MENRKAISESKNDRKRQMITEAADIVQRRRMEFQSCITMLNKDIEEDCCKEGEEKHEILYFLKANRLRKQI